VAVCKLTNLVGKRDWKVMLPLSGGLRCLWEFFEPVCSVGIAAACILEFTDELFFIWEGCGWYCCVENLR
jgi:hypothetical protein